MKPSIRFSFIFFSVIISCTQKQSHEFNPPDYEFIDSPKTVFTPYKEDTLFRSNDTIIIKNPYSTDTLLKFNSAMNDRKYFVSPEKIQLKQKLDFSKYEYNKRYITVTKEGVKKDGVNFAGHFCFVYWGCGSPCSLSAVVDMKTGIVYNGIPSSTGYAFKKNSKLLVINPPDSSGWYNKNVSWQIPLQYIWTGKKFIEYKHENKSSSEN